MQSFCIYTSHQYILYLSLYFYNYIFLTAACNFKVGWAIKARELNAADGYTMVAPKQQFFCNGELTTWHYQATTLNGFKAIVLRPLDGSRIRFKVVGINDIPAAAEKMGTSISHNVPEGNRIRVERGDVIGWSFDVGVIPYDFMSDNDESINLIRWIDKNQFALHDIITFDGYGSREYSIEANVQVSNRNQTVS